MRTYSYVKMIVDGNETVKLDIWSRGNIFSVFERGSNVFEGSFSKTVAFIEDWKRGYDEIKGFLESAGHRVSFEQTIK